jgi:CRISPR-associated protein Cas5d
MVSVVVWGDFACFTRPEHKVERMSYDVMTPSAARGILEAIAWKPEFAWRVRRIHVLAPIRRASLVRNEVAGVASFRAAKGWAGDEGRGGYDVAGDRRQRFSLVLRDVRYRIDADVHLHPHATDPVAKYESIFLRRVEKGQTFQRPYLGTREFAASFGPSNGDVAIDLSDDLGRMLFDMRYVPDPEGPVTFRTHGREGPRWTKGRIEPVFFSARLERGMLEVPADLYQQVG